MTERHLIIFGEHAEQQIRKHLSKVKSYKEAQWLYDGILYQNDVQDRDLVNIIFKDPKFSPTAIIDNGKWLAPALFGNNQAIWREAIKQCFATASHGYIHCYTYFE